MTLPTRPGRWAGMTPGAQRPRLPMGRNPGPPELVVAGLAVGVGVLLLPAGHCGVEEISVGWTTLGEPGLKFTAVT